MKMIRPLALKTFAGGIVTMVTRSRQYRTKNDFLLINTFLGKAKDFLGLSGNDENRKGHIGELQELKNEDILLECMVSPKAYIGKGGHVTGLQFIHTEMGNPDETGHRRSVEIGGSEFEVLADTVLLALASFRIIPRLMKR